MKQVTIGLIGLGTVGRGVAKLIKARHAFVQRKFGVDLRLKTVCDLRWDASFVRSLGKVTATKNFNDILNDKDINVVGRRCALPSRSLLAIARLASRGQLTPCCGNAGGRGTPIRSGSGAARGAGR